MENNEQQTLYVYVKGIKKRVFSVVYKQFLENQTKFLTVSDAI